MQADTTFARRTSLFKSVGRHVKHSESNHAEPRPGGQRNHRRDGRYAGAGLLSVAMQSNIPAVLAFLGTVAYAASQVWKAYVDRDKRHHDQFERRLEIENDRLRHRLRIRGLRPTTRSITESQARRLRVSRLVGVTRGHYMGDPMSLTNRLADLSLEYLDVVDTIEIAKANQANTPTLYRSARRSP